MSLVQLEDLQMLLQIIILGNSLISLALASTFREQMVCLIVPNIFFSGSIERWFRKSRQRNRHWC